MEEATAAAVERALGLDPEQLAPPAGNPSAIQVEVVVKDALVEDFWVSDEGPYREVVDAVFDYYVDEIDSGRRRFWYPAGTELVVHAYGIEGIGEKIRADHRGDLYERRREQQEPDTSWARMGRRVRYTGPASEDPEFPTPGEGGTIVDFYKENPAMPEIEWDRAVRMVWDLKDLEPENSDGR